MCPLGRNANPTTHLAQQPSTRWRTADRTMDARKSIEKSGSSLYARQPHLASTYRSKNSLTPPHSTSLLYYPSEFWNRKGTGHTRKNTENTRWKHHHRNFNGSAQYVDTATTLLPCNRAPATNGQSTIWRHRHTWTSPQNMRTPLPCNTRSTTVTQPWYHDHFKWTTWNTYVQSVSKTSQQSTNIISTGKTITL